jgi:hypothetical protein
MRNGAKNSVEILATFQYSQGKNSVEMEWISLFYRKNSGYP